MSTVTIGDVTYTLNSGDLTASVTGNALQGVTNVTIPPSITDGNQTYTVTSIGSTAFRNSSNLASIVIPNTVTSIANGSASNGAFRSCSALTAVTIGANVTTIGNNAFRECSELTAVIIPDVVTSIGNNAFRECSKLTAVTIGSSVASIGNNAFYLCSELTAVTIGSSVASIGQLAFGGCSKLTAVIIPDAVASIGNGAFQLCSELTAVTIGANVTTIGEFAFYEASLTAVTIPASVTSIGQGAFSIATLKDVYFLGNNETALYGNPASSRDFFGYQQFNNIASDAVAHYVATKTGWDDYTSADPPAGFSDIQTFDPEGGSGGSSTPTILGPNNVDDQGLTYSLDSPAVGEATVSGYSGPDAAAIVIPAQVSDGTTTYNVVNIDLWGALIGKTYASITVSNDHPYYVTDANGLLYKKVDNELSVIWAPSSTTSIVIPDSINNTNVTGVETFAFYGSPLVTSVTFGMNIKFIRSAAFLNLTNLENITIPDSVTLIESGVFQGTGLTSVTFGQNPSLLTIGTSAFSSTPLTSFIIPNSVTSIGEYVFGNCSLLTSVTVPNSITTSDFLQNALAITDVILSTNNPNFVFSNGILYKKLAGGLEVAWVNCVSNITIPFQVGDASVLSLGTSSITNSRTLLTSVTIPDSVTSIGDNAFRECIALTAVTIPDAVTTIGQSAFRECIALTAVTIPDAVTTIGQSAFFQCSALTAVIIPDAVTSIGNEAFQVCSALTAVTIGSSVTTIGTSAFGNCTALTGVTIPNSVTYIGDYGFYNGSYGISGQMTALTIGSGVTHIGSRAFQLSSLTAVTIPASVTYIGENAFSIATLTNVYFLGNNENALYGDPAESHDFFGYGQFVLDRTADPLVSSIASNAVAYYVNGKTGWNGYSSVALPAGFSDIQTFDPEGSGPSPTASAIRACLSCNPNSSSLNIINVTGNNGTVVYKWLKDGTIVGTDLTFDYITTVDCVGSTLVAQVGDDDGYVTIATMTIGPDYKIALVIADTYVNIIPNSNNDNKAFYYGFRQNDLTSVVIGNAVTSIGDHAFSGNISLVDVTIGPSVGYIENWAFGGMCPGITSITIPDATTNINNFAFNQADAHTHNINTFHIGAGLQNVNSVKNSDNYVTTLTISPSNPYLILDEQGVVYVKVDANNVAADFVLYDKTSVIIPATVTFDGADIPVTSINCDALTNVTSLTIDAANTMYAEQDGIIYQKFDATNATITKVFGTVTNVNIPDTIAIGGGEGIPVTSIPDWLFSDRTSLTSVSIGNNVSYIGGGAFNNTRIESISIPASVTVIEFMAFSNNPSLTGVTFAANSQLTTLRNGLFDNTKISTINIPNSVVDIQDGVFNNCLLLTNVTIPYSVTSMGANTFTGCALLTDLSIDSANTTYVEQDGVVYQKVDSANAMVAFGLFSLTSANMPSSVSIDTASIPVTTIGEFAFFACSALTAVTIPDAVTSIGRNAFRECIALTAVTIGANVTSIGNYAFMSCTVLTVVTMGASVTTIGNSAFTDCTSLETINIGANVASIGNEAFTRCYNVSTVTIPASVTYIGSYAFIWCGYIQSVYFLGDNTNNRYFDNNQFHFRKATDPTNLWYYPGYEESWDSYVSSAPWWNPDVKCPPATAYYIDGKDGWSQYASPNTPPIQFASVTTFVPEGSDSAPNHSIGVLNLNGGSVGAVSGGHVNVSAGDANIQSTTGAFALALNGGNAVVTTLNGSVSANATISVNRILSTSAGNFEGLLYGSGTLEKTGSGTLTLSGSSGMGFSGKVAIKTGTVEAQTTTSLSGAAVELGSSGSNTSPVLKFIISGSTTSVIGNSIRALSSGSNILQNAGAAPVSLAGGVTKDGTIVRLLGSFVVNSDITGSSANSDLLVGDGISSAYVTLVSGNTYDYNGPTTVNTGSTLTLQDGVALSDSDVTINAGATLVLEYTTSTITANSVNSLTLSGATDLQWDAGINGATLIVNISINLTAGDYTVLAVNTNGDAVLYPYPSLTQVNYTGSNGSSASITEDSNGNFVVTITAPPTPTSNVCFPAKTPVMTNLGPVNIEDINPAVHTIRNKKIVAITKTVAHDKNLVRIAKHALGHLYPEKTTLISQNHKVFCQGQMIKAKHLVDEVKGVTFVPYNGQVLYNVLLEQYEKMQVNNLIVETLHPEHKVAKLYRFLKNVDAAHHGKFIAAFNKKDLEQRLHR